MFGIVPWPGTLPGPYQKTKKNETVVAALSYPAYQCKIVFHVQIRDFFPLSSCACTDTLPAERLQHNTNSPKKT